MIIWNDRFSDLANRALASAIRSLDRIPKAVDTISFGAGAPDQNAFPTSDILRAFREFEDREVFESQALPYGPTKGSPALIDQIVQHMARRGVTCQPSNVMITSGSQQALHLVCEALLNVDDVAAVDQCSYPGALQVLSMLGAKLKSTDEVAREHQCKVIYTTPTFQNPTGATYNLAEREALLFKAHELDAVIIEDDPYEVLRYDGTPPPSILSLDCAQGGVERSRTVYLGSFSKSIAPGLRIGWIIAPSELIEKVALLRETEDLQPNSLTQFLLTRLLSRSIMPSQARAIDLYRKRRDELNAALTKHLSELATWTVPEGGFFFWLTLPDRLDAQKLLPVAAKVGVTYVPGAAFSYRAENKNNIRLSFSSASPALFDEGVARLRKAIEIYLFEQQS